MAGSLPPERGMRDGWLEREATWASAWVAQDRLADGFLQVSPSARNNVCLTCTAVVCLVAIDVLTACLKGQLLRTADWCQEAVPNDSPVLGVETHRDRTDHRGCAGPGRTDVAMPYMHGWLGTSRRWHCLGSWRMKGKPSLSCNSRYAPEEEAGPGHRLRRPRARARKVCASWN